MSHYFIVEAATPTDIIFAYRGDDNKNSLPIAVPSNDTADGKLNLPAAMTKQAVEHYLAHSFVNLAVANPGHRILLRLADNNVVTCWILPLPEKP